jgi:erythromycin esterase
MRWQAFLALSLLPLPAMAQPPVAIDPARSVERAIAPGQVYAASLRLRRGESAEIAVLQQGIDLAVDLIGPDGRLLETVDSPNGRNGDEPVAIVATIAGDYVVRIRPLGADEPAGRFTLRVAALRDRAATARLAEGRRRARREASAWLAARSAPLPAPDAFDALVAPARVVGLGEATHGSRELNDIRIAFVARLVERHGYRLIALEDSASRWRDLAGYVAGAARPPEGRDLEWGWIGRRARHALLLWARQWNLGHPGDLVRIVGVDPQDSRAARERLDAYVARAYGAEAIAVWRDAAAELAAADDQVPVFGNSDVGAASRARLLELHARLETDRPLLAARFGEEATQDALAAARDLVQFADFNGNGGALGRSRDWYMAVNLLAAMDGPVIKAIYWGHNAHVSAVATRGAPTGAVLRQALGCSYVAVATTFNEGAFVAQLPNDPEDRLRASSLPAAAEGTVEAVLAGAGPGPRLAAWGCGGAAPVPAWLREPRPLRWIGGLYAPETPPGGTYRPYRLTDAFDAIVYFPRVAAEDIPAGLPRIPARPRTP